MARIISELSLERRRAGRPQGIDDGSLRGARDHLVSLLESTWGDVGYKLRTLKSAADVRGAFQAWARYSHPYAVVDVLLRPSNRPATSQQLNALRCGLSRLNASIRASLEIQQQRRERLVQAERALAGSLSDNERERITFERNKRADALACAEAEYESLNKERKDQEQVLKEGEAYFACAEVVRFCKSRRYTLTPINTANALAGLPLIGWRQSAKRCSKWGCPVAGSLAYECFKVICRIVTACPHLNRLVIHAENWLRAKPSAKSHAASELRKEWYYLRRSIEQVLDTKPVRKRVPFMITSQYLNRKECRSAVDMLLEEEERILL